MRKAIIIGVGPDRGLGAQLCKRFASEGLHVLVAGRTRSALDAVAAEIESTGGKATAVVADATNEADIVSLFQKGGDDLELAIYNAGNNTPGRVVEMEASYFEQSWRVVCFGGFLFGREAVRRMLPQGSGTLLFTGASASLRGRSGFGAFNSAKAGLRSLAQAMAKEYAPAGIHVGHVIVDGAIGGEKIMKRFPDAAGREGSLISTKASSTHSPFYTDSRREPGLLKLMYGHQTKSGDWVSREGRRGSTIGEKGALWRPYLNFTH